MCQRYRNKNLAYVFVTLEILICVRKKKDTGVHHRLYDYHLLQNVLCVEGDSTHLGFILGSKDSNSHIVVYIVQMD